MIKLCYVNTLNIGVSYWRLENPAQEMLNFPSRVRPFVEYFVDPRESYSWEKVCLGTNLSQTIQDKLHAMFKVFDVVIIQKLQTRDSIALIGEMRKLYPKTKLIAEIDDSIGDITPSNYYADQLKDEHHMAVEHVMMSDGVIVSTDYLRKEVSKLTDKPIHVMPNCIHWDTWKWDKKKRKKRDHKNIGYVAGGGHDEDLHIVYRAIEPLLSDKLKLVVRYGGFRPDFLKSKHVDFKIVDCHISKYPQMIYDLDLDLMVAPLRDTEFNRCKSNLKWLESSSQGITLVGSNVEAFNKTNGSVYLASNDIGEWRSSIELALEKPFKAKELILQNRTNYNINKEVDGVLGFCENLMI